MILVNDGGGGKGTAVNWVKEGMNLDRADTGSEDERKKNKTD